MTDVPDERLRPEHRLRTSRDYATVKAAAKAHRGRHCVVLAATIPGEITRVGFITSRRSVGNAVQRNRARRRLREIVRRRWTRMNPAGLWLAFVAYRTAVSAPHLELVAEVERLLTEAGALDSGPTS